MDNPAKGGRGKKAPYESTHYRLPVPLKPIAEELAANYRELVTEYSNPEDPALIAAVLAAISPSQQPEIDNLQQLATYRTQEVEQLKKELAENKELVQQYQQMEAEIEQLNQQIEKLKLTKDRDMIVKAMTEFIEFKKHNFGKSPSQKNKEFSLDTRQWDAFREFMKFIQD